MKMKHERCNVALRHFEPLNGHVITTETSFSILEQNSLPSRVNFLFICGQIALKRIFLLNFPPPAVKGCGTRRSRIVSKFYSHVRSLAGNELAFLRNANKLRG
jgi:hypothetical protein